ncbi:DUF6489 family protein [Arhodomonas sp. SL1]|uniref:DUF6489 family protein n=1 Tax=Arhodomonas sp. SL1 TaxID=3425691 RepID=UPI003F88338C
MRIKVDVDATPEELRRFLGLPDVSALQDEVVAAVRERMQEGWEGYDPAAFLRTWAQPDVPGMQQLQEAFLDALRRTNRGGGTD